MRTYLFKLTAAAVALAAVALGPGCEDAMHSNYYDLGAKSFKQLGEPCLPDVAPSSECGYWPQFYCSAGGRCTSACNSTADCSSGATCIGSGAQLAGECHLVSAPADAGSDL